MPDQPQTQKGTSKARRPAPPWLRFASVCVVLIVVPVVLYLFIYQRSRVQDATIRNFRALDAAAVRVDQVLERLSSVVNGSSFGLSPALLDGVSAFLGTRSAACGSDIGASRRAWTKPALQDEPFASPQPTDAQRLRYRYWLAAHTLFESNEKDDGATRALWEQLRCLVSTHRRYSRPSAPIEVEVTPSPRLPLFPAAGRCVDRPSSAECVRLRQLLAAEDCRESAPSPLLNAGRNGVQATLADCRRLRERHREIHGALNRFQGSEAVIRAIDLFAIRSTAELATLMREATGYLSRFFDSHLIADADGRILFEEDASLTAGAETDERQAATPAFSNHVDITELVRVDSPPTDGSERGGAGPSASDFRGRSFMTSVRVADVDLLAFVHPFVLDGLDAGGDAGPDADAARASSNDAGRPTFYLVGLVDGPEFRSAAIRLRLALVVEATLLLLVLLTLTPLLRLWTAGDRLAVGRSALIVACATPVVGLVLLTVLACGMVTNRIDGRVLDGVLEQVSDRLADLFDQEMGEAVGALQRAVPRLLARAQSEPRRRSDGKVRLWRTADLGGETLSRLERAFYCDDSARSLDYDPREREIQTPTLLDGKGRQRVCLGSTLPVRNPPLDLAFREYFRLPRQGALWRPRLGGRRRPVRCRIRVAQDEESRIPCLVDGLLELTTRMTMLSSMSSLPSGGAEAPYFLERIDSVVGGQVATVLAVQTGSRDTPVATSAVPLNSLDFAVPPQHVDFAVVDRETGRTLFHSDDDLAMTTNFVDDVGGGAALWSLLRSEARDTISLVYAGVPIRAHVRPLRPGMPWALIVYRGHELEDRLTTVTISLTLFYTLSWLMGLGLLAGLLLLAVHWWAPGLIGGIPSMIGRAAATVARLRWWFAALVGVVLLLLLYGPALALHPGPPGSPWLPWNPWTVGEGWNPWPVFPVFAVCSAVVVVAFLTCCVLGLRRPAGDNRYGASTLRRVVALAIVLAGFSVAPAWLWFGHHRAALGTGLNHYLEDRTLESVALAREEYRIDRMKRHGTAVAPAGDRTRYRVHEEPESDEGWVLGALRPLIASSRLASELLVHRGLTRPATDGVFSLYGVFRATFGYDVTWPLSQPDAGRLWVLSLSSISLIVALLGAVAYSLCAVCTMVGGRLAGVVKLPDANRLLANLERKGPFQQPLRAIVLHRGEWDRECFVQRLEQFFPARSRKVYSGGYGRHRVVGSDPPGATRKKAIHVFDDLEDVLRQDADGRAQFAELQRLVDDKAAVVLYSRVVPDHRYSERRPADRSVGDREYDVERWSRLAGGFRLYALRPGPECETYFNSRLHGLQPPRPASCDAEIRIVEQAMREEAVANPPLLESALNVVVDMRRKLEENACSLEDARAVAVASFRQSAARHFDRLWADSTRDERLQLDALANGGAVDSRRTPVLSSLMNRGLVEENADSAVVRLRSEAFREHIRHDVDHGELEAWRKEGDGGTWRFIWPPVAVVGVLGLAFLAMANPEMRTPLLTSLLALVPAALPVLRGGQGGGAPQT